MPLIPDDFALEVIEEDLAIAVTVELPDAFLGNGAGQNTVTVGTDDAFSLEIVEEVLLVEVVPEQPDLFLETVYLQGPAGRPGVGSVGETPFTGQNTVTVNHYRGYRPIVSLSNTTGREIDGAVEHHSLNSFTVLFNLPQSGFITYF